MAARMSRALAFSPLAIVAELVGDASGALVRVAGASMVSAGAGVSVVGGGGVSFGPGGSGSPLLGFSGSESNSVGCLRDAFIRATCDPR